MQKSSLSLQRGAQYLGLSILIVAIVTGAAMWKSSSAAKTYFGSLGISVKTQRVPQAAGSGLILQPQPAADMQASLATTQAWLADPAFVQTILLDVGTAPHSESLKALSQVFKASSPVIGAGSYQIEYDAATEQEVLDIFAALQSKLNAKAAGYNKVQGDIPQIYLDFGTPVVTNTSSALPLTPIAGLAVGVVFALVVVALLERKRV